MDIKELKKMHLERKEQIKKRLDDFSGVKKDPEKVFEEFCFCTFTPQSKALNCWSAVMELKKRNLLHSGNSGDIGKVLQKKVRFHNNKAKYIVENRKVFFNGLKEKVFTEENHKNLREHLVENVRGYGYKEASHFLRNVGFRNLAILDRHILKHLVELGVIKDVPKSLTGKKYMEIEKKFLEFSEKIGIPIDELDLLFWSLEAGEIFK